MDLETSKTGNDSDTTKGVRDATCTKRFLINHMKWFI